MVKGKLDAVGVIVSDLRRAVRFYRMLGAPFPEGAEESEHGHAEAQLEGGLRLLLDTEESIRSFDPGWRRATGSPSSSVAFHCTSPAAVDELYAQALEAGGVGHKEPWDAFWGQRYALLRDPDGNAVDLYADLDRTG
jgi:catechol 2,3-dioxygenase-like lactoylglutathione lyase family enzyme